MKFHSIFKNIDSSESLLDYAKDKFSKLEKYELKPVSVNMTFSAQRHRKLAEVTIIGPDVKYHAKAWSGNYYESLDKVLDKIMTQMSKVKNKRQKHKAFEKSARGRAQILESLQVEEYDQAS